MKDRTSRYDAPFIARLYLPRVVAEGFAAQDRALAPAGLTSRQALILLSCDLGEAATAAELAELYGLEVSSITRLVDRLEKKRLIERTPSRKDRRKTMLTLTPRGKSALEHAVKIATPIALAMWKGVSEKERRMLAVISQKVLKNLNELGPGKKEILPLMNANKRR
jgi:DNA-binding MarR family transcriptional regulator